MENNYSKENISLEDALKIAIANEGADGIGVLAEKLVHGTLKYFYCNDKACHEIKYKGFVADILEGDIENSPHITEIQTRQAYRLTRKLEAYDDDADVRIVLPVIANKKIVWLDPSTGSFEGSSKTSRPKNIYHSLREIYALRNFINKPNICITIPLLSTTEYRLLDGIGDNKKKRATKYQIVPEKIIKNYTFKTAEDYNRIFPQDLPELFTAFDFAKAGNVPISDARYSVLVFAALGIIKEYGRDGNKKIWKKVFEKNE